MKKEDFDRIYMEYHKLVQHVAFDILQDHNLAQDVCQEVFIKLHQKIERLDENLIKGWILRNTHRKSIDFWRKSYRKREIPVVGETIEGALVSEYLVEKETECRRKEFRNFLLDELKEKNPLWHDLMVRVVVENEPASEVAREYGLSELGMWMRLSRARRWLYANYYQSYRKPKGPSDR